jgi:hypothetical protein
VILLVVLMVAVILSRVITRPVATLKEGAAAIGDGSQNPWSLAPTFPAPAQPVPVIRLDSIAMHP